MKYVEIGQRLSLFSIFECVTSGKLIHKMVAETVIVYCEMIQYSDSQKTYQLWAFHVYRDLKYEDVD